MSLPVIANVILDIETAEFYNASESFRKSVRKAICGDIKTFEKEFIL